MGAIDLFFSEDWKGFYIPHLFWPGGHISKSWDLGLGRKPSAGLEDSWGMKAKANVKAKAHP